MKIVYFSLSLFFIVILTVNIYAKTLEDIQAKFGKADSDIDKDGDKDNIVMLDTKEAEKFIYSRDGRDFFGFYGTGWKHARAGDFIFHFRKTSNMKRLAGITEKMVNTITADLLIDEEDSKQRNKELIIIYLMDDEGRWKRFLSMAGVASWAVGFANGDEIFLYIDWGSTQYRPFALRLLAHELTHIVFRRLYPGYIPEWLNEGFAEYEEAEAGKYIKQAVYSRHKEMNKTDSFDIDELIALQNIPSGRREMFYLQSKRLVSFLYKKHGKEDFIKLIKVIQSGVSFQEAVMQVYKNEYSNYKTFKSSAARYK